MYNYIIMKRILYLFLVAQLIMAAQINITGWEFRIVSENIWRKADVPSTVHLDLLDNGIIEDPYLRDNLLKTYWIELQDVQYKTTFQLGSEILNTSHKYLVFEGLDTHCDVILNGKNILKANNMFRRWKIPIQNFQANNNISVYFYSNAKHDLAAEQALKKETGIVLPANYSHTRKAAYQYGWDWGPRLLTVGIWKNVYLEYYQNQYFEHIYLRNDEVTIKSTQTNIYIQSKFSYLKVNSFYKLYVNIIGKQGSFQQTDNFQATSQNFTYTLTFKIVDPKLWWTHDIGTPYLYDIKVNLLTADSIKISQKSVRYGIRTVKVIQTKDARGTGFTVSLNGKQIFMRGGNYIPPDMFMPRALKNPKVYYNTINDALFAKYNMLRVWGGGQFQYDIFYDLCDQKGILIWHDLMFACAMYPGQTDTLENIRNEMIDNLIRLRNHPSIAIWNGNNQVWIGWQEWGWKSGKTAEQLKLLEKWYNDIFRVTLAQVILEYNPDNFYWETSPSSSSNQVSTINSGDIHFWRVWGGGTDIEQYTRFVGRFNSEYGMQSMAQYSSIVRFTNEGDRSINSLVMRIHQRHVMGDTYLPMYTTKYVGNTSDLKTYTYLSQIMQSYALQTAINSLRVNKPFCMGSLYWQINDVWPVASWATVDFYGQYKASHYTARRLYGQVLVNILFTNDTYNFHVINENLDPIQGTFSFEIMEFSGKMLSNVTKGFVLPGNMNVVVMSMKAADLDLIVKDKSSTLINLEFDGEDQSTSSNNIFYFKKPVELNAPIPNISLKWLQPTELEISTDSLARYIYVYNTQLKPLKLQQNYFDLRPNTKKVITIPEGNKDQIAVMEYFRQRSTKTNLMTE